MKKIVFDLGKIGIIMLLVFTSTSIMAQRGEGYGRLPRANEPGNSQICRYIPDMTPEQEQKINNLHAVHLKEMNNFRNDLMIKRAELNKLQSEDNADANSINAKIEEIGKIKTEMAKKRSSHMLSVRSLLTENQRAFFDARKGKNGLYNGSRNGFRYRMN